MTAATRSLVAAMLAAAGSVAYGADFEVTVTNLTRGQQFTPILVASHKPGGSGYSSWARRPVRNWQRWPKKATSPP
jgi:hypothetical protein